MFAIIDFRRYRGLVAVAVPLIAALGICNGVLAFALSSSMTRLPLTLAQIDDSTSAIEGLARYTREDSTKNRSFLLYLGASSAWQGIQTERLAEADAYGDRVCGLCGTGARLEILRFLAQPLIRKHIRPDVTLLCLHPAWLARNPTAHDPRPTLRVYMNYSINTLLTSVREWLDINRADRSPWTTPKSLNFPQHCPPEFVLKQVAQFEKYGFYDARHFASIQQSQADILIGLIRQLQHLGSDVIIVLMPEQAAMRDRIPPEARQYLNQRLEQDLNGAVPSIWDLVDALPDDMFCDLCHPNDEGRVTLTNLLASRLREYRVTHP